LVGPISLLQEDQLCCDLYSQAWPWYGKGKNPLCLNAPAMSHKYEYNILHRIGILGAQVIYSDSIHNYNKDGIGLDHSSLRVRASIDRPQGTAIYRWTLVYGPVSIYPGS